MPSYPTISATDLELLRKFDTPTVCNVIELFNLRPHTAGYMDARIQACYPKLPPMVGYASTTTFRSGGPPKSGNVYAGLSDQVALLAESPGPTVVIVQDLDNPTVSATFGEVLCSTYKAFGAAGLIASGAGRDLDQVEPLNFPCYSSGIIASHGYCHFLQLNVEVHVGGVSIHPGELIHGDRNGVTTIPLEIASAVAHGCQEFMEAEKAIFDYLKFGRLNAQGFTAAQKECKDRIERLAKKLRKG
jgi:4-hydroxy-4-methyl-2-oxoglutarate aldolase